MISSTAASSRAGLRCTAWRSERWRESAIHRETSKESHCVATPWLSPRSGSPAPGFPANPSSSAFPDPARPCPAHSELEGGEALNADPWLWDRLYSLRRCRQNFAGISDDHRTGVGSVLLGRLLGVIVAAPELWCVESRVLGGFGAEFRNQYDNDVTVWSPQGRIHQIEYAMEAVKQGSATVGLKSKTHAVLVALKRAQSELAAHQKKILHVDNHIGISIAGLTADARLLCNFMRQECLDSRFVFDRPLPVSRLVSLIGSKTQIPTQRYGRRPYGVGLLIAGYDDMGPHIFQTCPSANYFDCRAMSIGARSQSARTYLERHMSEFMECNLDELVKHGLRALRETLPAEQDLTTKNVSIGIVGKDLEFTIYDDDDVSPFLDGLEERPQRKAQPSQAADEPAEKVDEPMEH
ncbi:Proteasome subunit alpha type-1 [Lemmus lemmus]